MDIVKFSKIKIFIIIVLIAIIVFSTSFLNLNYFWDDERFVFMNPTMLSANSWIRFWQIGTSYFKSWPLGYSFFWIMFRFFEIKSLIIYKVINIFLHALNSFCAYKIFDEFKFKYSFWASLVFLLHPMHVETVSWIFQFFTLSSCLFFLISLYCFLKFSHTEDGRFFYLSLGFFILSLLCKPVAILGPLLFLLLSFVEEKRSKVKIYLLPLFAVSLVVGLLSVEGASNFLKRQGVSTTSSTNWEAVVSKSISVLKNNIQNKSVEPIKNSSYFDFRYNVDEIGNKESDRVFSRWDVFKQATIFYFRGIVVPYNLTFLYAPVEYSNIVIMIVYLFITIFIIYLFKITKDKLFIFSLVSFISFLIPYLGFSYIPFYFWSYVSNRYTYYSIFFLAFFICLFFKYFDKVINRKYLILYVIYLFFANVLFGLKFNSPIKIYEEAYVNRPHPVVCSLLFEQYLLIQDKYRAENILSNCEKKFPASKIIKDDKVRIKILN